MAMLRWCAALAAVVSIVLAGCGAGGNDPAPQPPVVVEPPPDDDPPPPDDDPPPPVVVLPPLPAGSSRIADVTYTWYSGERLDRHAYDEDGRLVSITSWDLAGGEPTGPPTRTITRSHDPYGRLVEVRTVTATGETSVTATYGPDGRLATTTTTEPDGRMTLYRFEWTDGRLNRVEAMVKYAGDGPYAPLGTAALGYGDDGYIAAVDWGAWLDDNEFRYTWRPDGQLAELGYRNYGIEGYVSSELHYDEQGLLVEILSTPYSAFDLDPVLIRITADERGRPMLSEEGYVPVDPPYPFSPYVTYRIQWEDGPCQPVYELSLPATVDWITGAASPVAATLVCSNRP